LKYSAARGGDSLLTQYLSTIYWKLSRSTARHGFLNSTGVPDWQILDSLSFAPRIRCPWKALDTT